MVISLWVFNVSEILKLIEIKKVFLRLFPIVSHME